MLSKPNEAKHLTPHAVTMIIRKAATAAGVWEDGFSAHALRRYFQTNLEASGLSPNWVKSMMGHTLQGVEGSYSKPTKEMLKDAYAKAYPTIATSELAEYAGRVESLEKDMKDLALENRLLRERLNGERGEKEGLASRVAELEKKLNTIDPEARRLAEGQSYIIEELRKYGLVVTLSREELKALKTKRAKTELKQ
jgi:hypothetical protein